VTLLFFAHDGAWADPRDTPQRADPAAWRWWRPECDGWPPGGPMQRQNCVWWALDRLGDRLGGFARPGLAELTLASTTQVHVRILVTPRWCRFPFMAAADLQIGGLWTHPDARRQGLCRAAMIEALRCYALPGQRIWFLVDADNVASTSLIRSLGFALIGFGERSTPSGIAAIGQFRPSRSLPPIDGYRSDRA